MAPLSKGAGSAKGADWGIVVVGARTARPGFAASGKSQIASGASSPHAVSVPRGDPIAIPPSAASGAHPPLTRGANKEKEANLYEQR